MQDPRAELFDRAIALSERDELVRPDASEVGVGPTQQGLHRHQVVGALLERDERLEVQVQLATGDRSTELRLDLVPAGNLLTEGVVEHAVAVPTTALDVVHRRIRLAEQHVRVQRRITGRRHADARGQPEVPHAVQGPPDLMQDAAGDLLGQHVVGVLEDHDELVAREP